MSNTSLKNVTTIILLVAINIAVYVVFVDRGRERRAATQIINTNASNRDMLDMLLPSWGDTIGSIIVDTDYDNTVSVPSTNMYSVLIINQADYDSTQGAILYRELVEYIRDINLFWITVSEQYDKSQIIQHNGPVINVRINNDTLYRSYGFICACPIVLIVDPNKKVVLANKRGVTYGQIKRILSNIIKS